MTTLSEARRDYMPVAAKTSPSIEFRVVPHGLSVSTVIDSVAEKYGLKPSSLRFGCIGGKARSCVAARAEAMAIVRRELGMSYPQIGRAFGGFNHTSVIYLVKRAGHIDWTPNGSLTRAQLTLEVEELRERVLTLENLLGARKAI